MCMDCGASVSLRSVKEESGQKTAGSNCLVVSSEQNRVQCVDVYFDVRLFRSGRG